MKPASELCPIYIADDCEAKNKDLPVLSKFEIKFISVMVIWLFASVKSYTDAREGV